MKRLILAAMLATGLAGAAHANDALKAAIANKDRTPANVLRDSARHPYETLTFFGLKPDMTLVELSTGDSWALEILGPYFDGGRGLIVAGGSPFSRSAEGRRNGARVTKMLEAQPGKFSEVQRGVFEPGGTLDYALPGTVDMAVSFGTLHKWTSVGDAKLTTAFKSVHTALKPGGVFGVVEPRMPASKPAKPGSGYLNEAAVIKLIEGAGFKLAAKSELNANPKGKAESDRMTLKFVKQ